MICLKRIYISDVLRIVFCWVYDVCCSGRVLGCMDWRDFVLVVFWVVRIGRNGHVVGYV